MRPEVIAQVLVCGEGGGLMGTWFDAAPWFEQAKDSDIVALDIEEYRGDTALCVARFCGVVDRGVRDVLLARGRVVCQVDHVSAWAWLCAHRPFLSH